jgi:hypothetical protein
MIATPSNGGTVSPSGGWYNAGSSVTIDATPNSNFEFVSWSGTGNGSYSGTNNPISITINGPITETANFTELYEITFTETGLPPGTMWYVNLSNGQSYNTTGNSIEIQIPNGSYSYMIATTNKEYSAQAGSLIVNGANLEISIKFNLVTYAITFTESGLSSGTSWSVTLNNITKTSTNGTIIFNEPNGTYSYTITTVNRSYAPSPSTGTITVNGNNVNIGITFNLVTYTVTFTESGLPSGTTWYVNLSNGQSYSSSTNTIKFNEANGTYSYTIATSNKEYAPAEYSGSFIVDGAPLSESITFNPVTYKITFTESGLSSGTNWYVTLNGIAKSSSNNTIIFNEPNGSYSYIISGIPGYRASSYSGTISVNGNSVSVPINWTIITYTITITENGIPNGTSWSATLTGTTFNGQYINITLSSTTNTITFNEPNGSYSYTIHLPSGYQSNSVKGQVNVSGNSAIATIKAQQMIKPPADNELLINWNNCSGNSNCNSYRSNIIEERQK